MGFKVRVLCRVVCANDGNTRQHNSKTPFRWFFFVWRDNMKDVPPFSLFFCARALRYFLLGHSPRRPPSPLPNKQRVCRSR